MEMNCRIAFGVEFSVLFEFIGFNSIFFFCTCEFIIIAVMSSKSKERKMWNGKKNEIKVEFGVCQFLCQTENYKNSIFEFSNLSKMGKLDGLQSEWQQWMWLVDERTGRTSSCAVVSRRGTVYGWQFSNSSAWRTTTRTSVSGISSWYWIVLFSRHNIPRQFRGLT